MNAIDAYRRIVGLSASEEIKKFVRCMASEKRILDFPWVGMNQLLHATEPPGLI